MKESLVLISFSGSQDIPKWVLTQRSSGTSGLWDQSSLTDQRVKISINQFSALTKFNINGENKLPVEISCWFIIHLRISDKRNDPKMKMKTVNHLTNSFISK